MDTMLFKLLCGFVIDVDCGGQVDADAVELLLPSKLGGMPRLRRAL